MNLMRRHFARLIVLLIGFALLVASPLRANTESSNESQHFALSFNESMNRCLSTGCANIEELIGFFADEASYIDETGQVWNGKASIRSRFLLPQTPPGFSDRIEGIDVAGSLITLRLERQRSFASGKYQATEVSPHVQVIVLKAGRIARLISAVSQTNR